MNILLVSGLFSAAESYGKGTATAEIIIMLLVAFILGYLLRYFLSGSKDTRDYDALLKKYQDVSQELEECKKQKQDLSLKLDSSNSLNNQLKLELEECLNLKSQLTADLDSYKNNEQFGAVAVPVTKDPSVRDDLKKIEGIGPKIEQLLYAEEIYTWDDLAKTEVKVIQAILDKAGPRYKVHNPESWPFQAEMAAKGEWEKLEKWQDEHKGGRF